MRLLKPLGYYKRKYGTSFYGLDKLYLMMEKQHNRGQEGAGIASVKLGQQPGHEYMYREKAEGKDAITRIFAEARRQMSSPDPDDPEGNPHFNGELYMGHLRYSTTGRGGLKYVHPFLRRNNWKAKNLCICGNFNMTNVREVFDELSAQGQYPRSFSDTYIMLELMGHRLDREVERNFVAAKELGLEGTDITDYIDGHVDMGNVLRSTMPHFDGGYVVCGITGSGEFFSMRDPWGIRPAFYYADDEIVAVASERPVLQTTFDLQTEEVKELMPGHALIVNSRGNLSFQKIMDPKKYSACSFERIYFSRGNDRDIYLERKELGRLLAGKVARAVDGDLEHTVVSYIPNTAEVAFYGLVEGLRKINPAVRAEKVVSKDIKLRTFITESESRNDLAAHVYDITAGSLTSGVDKLVVIDDSIVRGTTLRESIIKILDRLRPAKMVIVSSAPQIRYPDFYGIDMSRTGDFIAFQACIALLRERGMENLISEVREDCIRELEKPLEEMTNPLRRLYEPFTAEELNLKMVELLRPKGVTTPIELVFQSLEGLHEAIPGHPGDWYFSGHYPTPGGNRMICRAYVDYCRQMEEA
ncbi:MAG: amidophosphoribosyltransferase [Bacteroidales bacterium]|nr:amidophosphoribosyltransferase [Bacteroidales bacterium]